MLNEEELIRIRELIAKSDELQRRSHALAQRHIQESQKLQALEAHAQHVIEQAQRLDRNYAQQKDTDNDNRADTLRAR